MLTSIQKRLLVLLKEIDALCEKNKIEYYLGGGCLLGAVRSGGFLPWDDDADIHMTKDNAMKFLSAEDQLPDKRIIYRGELETGTSPVHWRYVDVSTTFTGKYPAVFDTPAGVFVDIFIIDPVQCTSDSKEAIRNDFLLFLQYRDRYRLSLKFPDLKLVKDYKILKEREETEGFETIKKSFEDRFWTENEGDYYLLRCPQGFMVPKNVFGTPVRAHFEDMIINIPEKPAALLEIGYGCRWVDVPHIAERGNHVSIKDMDVPYTIYNSDAARFKENRSDIKKLFKDIKATFFSMYENQRKDNKKYLLLKGKVIEKRIELFLKGHQSDIYELINKKDFGKLEELFAEYYELQFGIGNKWDICVSLSEDYLYAAVLPMLYKGDFEKTGDLLEIYFEAEEKYCSDRLKAISDLCKNAEKVTNLIYVDKNLKKARSLVNKYLPDWSWTVFMARIDSYLLLNEGDEEKCNGAIKRYVDKFPRDGELLSYYGDVLYNKGLIDQSLCIYKKALATLRNGLVITHINKRLRSIENDGE